MTNKLPQLTSVVLCFIKKPNIALFAVTIICLVLKEISESLARNGHVLYESALKSSGMKNERNDHLYPLSIVKYLGGFSPHT